MFLQGGTSVHSLWAAGQRPLSESAGRRPSRVRGLNSSTARASYAKFVTKDSVTFDVTLNPDFSQVESDDPQLTVNQRFAVFFPEKRPFFIENAGVLCDADQFVFSRRIADPQFGTRVTGNSVSGRWAPWSSTTGGRGRDSPAALTTRERRTAWCA